MSKQIIINPTLETSEKDFDDLKLLLEDICNKYHFKWHVNSYERSLSTGDSK